MLHNAITSPWAIGRCLVLVDVENLAATSSPTEREVDHVYRSLVSFVGRHPDTLFEVACSHHAAQAVRFGFPAGRHQWRSGRDGADHALVEVLRQDLIPQRFGRVVIASGDGIFADEVASLAAKGVWCEVISRRESLSARLRLAACSVHYIGEPRRSERPGHGTACRPSTPAVEQAIAMHAALAGFPDDAA